jgi:formiminoglutamase
MENIILLSQNELAKITNHRSGEIKFGEKIITIPKDTDIIEFMTSTFITTIIIINIRVD